MRSDSSWKNLFPEDETKIAIRFLCDTWNKVTKTRFPQIHYNLREPNMTQKLHDYLEKFKNNSGLTGNWFNESQMKASTRSTGRIKMDIRYFSNSSPKQLDLTFEFKKLSQSTCAEYYGKNGMGRFVDGDYAVGMPLAIMVGIHLRGNEEVIDTLINSLKSRVKTRLNMVANTYGKCINRPSNVIDSIAEFDTEHIRPKAKSPPKIKSIIIAHIFLDCKAE